MGGCTSKNSPKPNRNQFRHDIDPIQSPISITTKENHDGSTNNQHGNKKSDADAVKKSPFFPFYSPSPAHYLFSKKSPARSSANSTPMRFFKRPFPPPSPAKHIKAVLAKRQGSVKPNEAAIPEGHESEGVAALNKSFGFSKHFGNKYELGDEVGRGHFGYTCRAKLKKGELKGQEVAVKVIPKAKVRTSFVFIIIIILPERTEIIALIIIFILAVLFIRYFFPLFLALIMISVKYLFSGFDFCLNVC